MVNPVTTRTIDGLDVTGAKDVVEKLFRDSGQSRRKPYLPLAPMPMSKVEKVWRCIHCGRPNWLDRLTCEGCGAPEGE